MRPMSWIERCTVTTEHILAVDAEVAILLLVQLTLVSSLEGYLFNHFLFPQTPVETLNWYVVAVEAFGISTCFWIFLVC